VSETVVRYTVHPDHVAENTRLVEAVYAELATSEPGGFTYATYLLDDGCTFLHVAHLDGDGAAPLASLRSFREFQQGLTERCSTPPHAQSPQLVGAFGQSWSA
jgi:hypothetical protein